MKTISSTLFLKLMRLWPPFLGAGIKVSAHDPKLYWVETSLRLTPLNINAVGVHFGGSLYAMADPFFMLMLIHHLGSDYVVWDKAATIRFKSPGKGVVKARFEISPEDVAMIKAETDAMGRCQPKFEAKILDAEGKLVAEIEKVLSVKKKTSSKKP